jgi:hypothetical protein
LELASRPPLIFFGLHRSPPFADQSAVRSRVTGDNGFMRKRIVGEKSGEPGAQPDGGWLNLQQLATVEISSEDNAFPIEGALIRNGRGWRAAQTGQQLIRLIFDAPLYLRRIQLRFDETACERTQEFTLRWSPAEGEGSTEIARQQWNFSPEGSTTEIEDYAVNLENLSVLELAIVPDKSQRPCVASLASLRVM